MPSSSWIGRWFKRDAAGGVTPGPIKANLGEDVSLVYDPETKRWISKKVGGSALPSVNMPTQSCISGRRSDTFCGTNPSTSSFAGADSIPHHRNARSISVYLARPAGTPAASQHGQQSGSRIDAGFLEASPSTTSSQIRTFRSADAFGYATSPSCRLSSAYGPAQIRREEAHPVPLRRDQVKFCTIAAQGTFTCYRPLHCTPCSFGYLPVVPKQYRHRVGVNTGSGCASVLKTYCSRGKTESSEKSNSRYFSVSLCVGTQVSAQRSLLGANFRTSQNVSILFSRVAGSSSTSTIEVYAPVDASRQCSSKALKICQPHSLSSFRRQ